MHSRAKLMVKSVLEKHDSNINHNAGEDFESLAASIEFNANANIDLSPLINSDKHRIYLLLTPKFHD